MVRKIREAEFEAEVLQQEGWVLVNFYADWCPFCRRLEPLLQRFTEENAGKVKVVRVDTDVEVALERRYGVRKIPTLVAFRGGQEVRRVVNPQSQEALEALIADE